MENFMQYVDYVVDGHLANRLIDLMNIILVKGNKFIINNFFILWTIAIFFRKVSAKTDMKWDDKWSGKFIEFLTRFKTKKPKP